MSNFDLLPINSTSLEKRLCQSFDYEALATNIQNIHNPHYAPVNFLPFLGWSLSVDYWGIDWHEDEKRNTIYDSFAVHAIKGTPESIRRVLRNAGYGEIDIVEGDGGLLYDGSVNYDGSAIYGQDVHWAYYTIKLGKPMTNAQAAEIKQMLEHTQPARCHLLGFVFTKVSHLYNAAITYDGTYNYGATI